MATVRVANGNLGSYLYIDYSFSQNISARTWAFSSSLILYVPSGVTFGAWGAFGYHDANLRKDGLEQTTGEVWKTLATYSRNGNYNSNGDAPSFSVSWAFNVRSDWGGYWEPNGSINVTGSSIGPAGSAPTGLDAALTSVGPDWAIINVSISSYGDPSSSDGRYIEAAVLGSSTYGNPYCYTKSMGTTSASIVVPGSPGGGSLTVMPNTQYYYGGYATNTVRSISTVAGQFTTLPATPVITAMDQGHGQIAFTVTHATEGSAETVAEEYSIDGGTTWVAITGGAFTLTLSAQTTVKVRRTSAAGISSVSITVVPQFEVGIYASVSGQSKKIKKIYLPINGVSKKVKKVYASVNGEATLVFEDVS